MISSIVFGQNTNPYKVFGCNTNANYEIPISCLFRVNNSDSKSNIKALAIDFDKSLAYLLGENDSIMKTLNIDPEEVLIWLSTDPKSDKYPSHSPYNYCANNPIMILDPNGKEWDLSKLKPAQRESYMSNINRQRQSSSSFNKMYSQLETSPNKYFVEIGNTLDNVPGHFNSANNTITYSNVNNMNSNNINTEEIFHAYQKENKFLYEKGKSINKEFEAKIATLLMNYESSSLSTVPVGGNDINKSLYEQDDSKIKIDNRFLNEYQKGANIFEEYNNKNNVGNSNYKTKTEQTPKVLIKLFTE